MVLQLVLLMMAVVFALQLYFCFRQPGPWRKGIPLLVISACDLLCWGIYFLLRDAQWAYALPFSAFVFGVVLLPWVGAAALAWGCYAVVKTIQKRRK